MREIIGKENNLGNFWDLLIRLMKHGTNCHGCWKERTKVQRGERTFPLLIQMTPNKKISTTKTNRESHKQSALNKVNLPQTQVGKRVPKYGSQSETTIDGCP